jgi:hypothetical protein
MRTYCYRIDEGNSIDVQFPAGKAPETIELSDGTVARRDYQSEMSGGAAFVKGSRNPVKRGWPMEPCYASGVHPSQAQGLRDHFKKHNLSVDVTPSGDPIYESAGQRRKALKCRGMHDNSSYD